MHPGLVLLAVISLVYIWATWGYVGLAWGDYGTWLHAVERIVEGERPYVDFYWMYPPLSLWVFGGVGSVFGLALPTIWVATSIIFLAIMAVYYRYVTLIVPAALRGGTVVVGALLAMAYAPIGSAPLSMGMYTPAAPLAVLFLLAAIIASIHALRQPSNLNTAMIGILSGLAVLTKHDVWLPAVWVVAVTALFLWRAGARRLAVIGPLTFAFTGGVGVMLVWMTTGWEDLSRMVWTPNLGRIVGARGQPSWERVVIQLSTGAFVVSVAAAAAFAAGLQRRRSRSLFLIAAIVWGGMAATHISGSFLSGRAYSVQSGVELPTQTQIVVTSAGSAPKAMLKRSVLFFRDRFMHHLLPTILPLLVGVLVWSRWRVLDPAQRRLIVVLLGAAIAARARRGFEHVEWFHFLIEIPLYLVVLVHVVGMPTRSRAHLVPLAVFLSVGLFGYWHLGQGRFTRRSAGSSAVASTARGEFRTNVVAAGDVPSMRATMDSLDPSGTWPLLTFGMTGGFNYYLNRPNPTPFMLGFALTYWDADSVLAPLYPPRGRLFFLDVSVYARLTRIAPGIRWSSWDLANEPTRFLAERRLVRPFTNGCQRLSFTGQPENPFFELYACGDD